MLAVRPSYRATAWRVLDGDKYFPSRLSLQSLLISSPGTSDSILDQHHSTLGEGEDVILTPGTWNPNEGSLFYSYKSLSLLAR